MSPRGPGKYDDLCALVRNRAMARGAIVIVLGGSKGSGFSLQGDEELTRRLPEILEEMIPQIRAALRTGDLDS
jgi:hypothetical protein